MTAPTERSWVEANQAHLSVALGSIKDALRSHATMERDPGPRDLPRPPQSIMDPPPALEHIAAAFGLTSFERDVLLLCAGTELDSSVATLCAAASGDAHRPWPTFGLAVAALPGAHWSALAPSGPLRAWRLIEIDGQGALTKSQLRVDERVLHYLVGVDCLDERLQVLSHRVQCGDAAFPTYRSLVDRIVPLWRREGEAFGRTVVQLCTKSREDALLVTGSACRDMGLRLYALDPDSVPSTVAEQSEFIMLWSREAALEPTALFLWSGEGVHPEAVRRVCRFLERVTIPVIAAGRESLTLSMAPSISIDVPRLSGAEQRATWIRALGTAASVHNGHLDEIVSQFDFGPAQITAASRQGNGSARALMDSCRAVARASLDDLAQRVKPTAGWDDLVLPARVMDVLVQIAAQVRRRSIVYDAWGFARNSALGLGITALFSGASGTGKTMAAEALARDLNLDLYRVDLSSVVSKYIGETEKNLRRVFDAAEDGGAILLFDEADALFGKRSEVKDSHDRYANIEVSYLLQRMESYRGLAILTSNMKSALDTAFQRRIRFLVQFPFPDAMLRAEIWRRMLPVESPVGKLDFGKLAQLNLAGGSIRSIALGAAFLAADAREPIQMQHMLRATRAEYAKLDRPLSVAETGGWE